MRRLAPATLALLAALAGCDRTPAASEPAGNAVTPAAEGDVWVRNAGRDGTMLKLDLDLGDERSPEMIDRAADAVLKIGRDMNAGKPPAPGRYDVVYFTVLGRSAGNLEAGRKIVAFAIPVEDLKQVAGLGLAGASALDVAQDPTTWGDANADVVEPYCRKRPTSPFCPPR